MSILTIIFIIIGSWLALGIIAGFITPIPSQQTVFTRRSLSFWIVEVSGGAWSLYVAIVMIYLHYKTRKMDRISTILSIVSQSFDDEVTATVGSHFGEPTAYLDGKQDMMVQIRTMLEQKLK